MKILNRKGFTLVELIAVIVLLSIVMGIGSYSIMGIINNTKEKDYLELIGEINNAVETYYQECRFVNNDCKNEITLGYLINYGFLSGNSTDDDGKQSLVNPKDKENIFDCKIKYTYSNGKINVEAVDASGSCPTSY